MMYTFDFRIVRQRWSGLFYVREFVGWHDGHPLFIRWDTAHSTEASARQAVLHEVPGARIAPTVLPFGDPNGNTVD